MNRHIPGQNAHPCTQTPEAPWFRSRPPNDWKIIPLGASRVLIGVPDWETVDDIRQRLGLGGPITVRHTDALTLTNLAAA